MTSQPVSSSCCTKLRFAKAIELCEVWWLQDTPTLYSQTLKCQEQGVSTLALR